MKTALFSLSLVALLTPLLRADVALPVIFSDHMVLQQGRAVPIWGTATAGEEVTVTFAGQTLKTKADGAGKWKTELASLPANAQPADLTVAGKNTITLKDVLVGEVWICSGQSNMQWTVSQAANAEAEAAAANYPQIRMFNVERIAAKAPGGDCKGQWFVTTPQTVGQFSAVGFFFGRHLHQALKVPVGLINTSWGGTRVEAWTSIEALKERPCARDMLKDWKDVLAKWDDAKEKAAFEKRTADWKAQVAKINADNAKLPAGKPKAPLPPSPRPSENPNATPHYPSVLFNGMVAPLIPYAFKGAIWYQGESNQRRAFQYQELLPTMINDWRKRWSSEFPFYIVQLAAFGNGQPITKEPGQADTWAELQEAQLLTAQTLPKTGIAVINDIGEVGNIHPKNKQEVGRRLALWALAKDYARANTVFSGPLYKSSAIKGNRVHVQFDYIGSGLKTRNGEAPGPFQIAGADGKWVWAKAKIEGDEVIVWADAVKAPIGVRYAWAAWPEGVNLINKEGLPASCFRTDDLPPSTLGVVSPFAENLPSKK